MTTTEEFLEELLELDVYLVVKGEDLWVDAPEGGLTPERLQTLREVKGSILEILSGPQSGSYDVGSDKPSLPSLTPTDDLQLQTESSCKGIDPDGRIKRIETPEDPAQVIEYLLSDGRRGVELREAETLLAQLGVLGVQVEANGNNLCIDAPQGAITPDILELLKDCKDDILTVISVWSPYCLQVGRRFGHYHTRLYPLIGKRVMTPKGSGKLWRVFADSIGVRLDSIRGQVTYFDGPEQIYPLGSQVAP